MRRKLRKIQFSLRTLLLLATICALGTVGWKFELGRREQAAMAWIDDLGGSVTIHPTTGWRRAAQYCFGGSVRVIDLSDTRVADLSPLRDSSKRCPNAKFLIRCPSRLESRSPNLATDLGDVFL